ncbi:MAG: 3-isopropylmalate dehydratase small subunit [Cyanobacteria bacterium J083]|nr:MAG: 3-isopropylmalate dehydratase small subunit [Cyanobacteria bacterium J083]
MAKITHIVGLGVPIIGNDIDTDRIIPARFLRCVTFDGLGEHAFADDRAQAQGKHPFDLPQYQSAKILVVNGNFGCGSSREHAPQALARWGIEAIIGESFAEIFFGNCIAIGVPCVTATPATIQQLQRNLQTKPEETINLDLTQMKVTQANWQADVSMPEGAKQMMVTGTWDNCAQLISDIKAIQATAANLPYLSWTN